MGTRLLSADLGQLGYQVRPLARQSGMNVPPGVSFALIACFWAPHLPVLHSTDNPLKPTRVLGVLGVRTVVRSLHSIQRVQQLVPLLLPAGPPCKRELQHD